MLALKGIPILILERSSTRPLKPHAAHAQGIYSYEKKEGRAASFARATPHESSCKAASIVDAKKIV